MKRPHPPIPPDRVAGNIYTIEEIANGLAAIYDVAGVYGWIIPMGDEDLESWGAVDIKWRMRKNELYQYDHVCSQRGDVTFASDSWAEPLRRHWRTLREHLTATLAQAATVPDPPVNVTPAVEVDAETPAPEPPAEAAGYLPAEIAHELDVCPKTLNKYAKRAGLATPAPGRPSEFRYTPSERVKIAREFASASTNADVVQSAKRIIAAEPERKPKTGN